MSNLQNFDSDDEAELIMKSPISKLEIAKAYKKATIKAYEKLMTQHLFDTFKEEGYLPSLENMPEDVKTMINTVHNRYSTKPPYFLVTINPRSTTTLEDLTKAIKKFTSKTTIKEFIYVYEVRKADYTGLHCHLLLRTTCRPYEFKRSAKNTFKHICDSTNSHILNFKNITEELLPEKISYLLGQKQEKKQSGVKITELYRLDNNLLPFYESNPPLPCRVTQKIA